MRTPFCFAVKFLELPAAAVDDPLAECCNPIVVGERLDKVSGLAAFDEIAPDHLVFTIEPQVFFNGTSRPNPNALVAKLLVDIPDGAFGFGHGCHHGVRC